MMSKDTLQTIILYTRAVIFNAVHMFLILLFFILLIPTIILPVRGRLFVIRWFLKSEIFFFGLICGVKYEIEGLENIKKAKVGVVMSKHQSTWETFFLPTVFHAPAIILKKELLRLPVFGWGLALSDPIAIDRRDHRSSMQQIISKGKKRLDNGRWVLVFPEGTRIPPGSIGNYRLGGARLASHTGYPIIPVAHNAGHFWPRLKFIKYPGTLKVVIGPPIESTNKTPEELLKETKDWIETTMLRIDPTHIPHRH